MFDRCIPPVRWLQRWFIPPKGIEDWQRIAFQPMLFSFMWIGAVLHLVFGDLTAVHRDDLAGGVYVAWMGLSLITPPMALAALALIVHATGRWRLRGLWLRLGADIGFTAAMSTYLVVKLGSGDFHTYSVFTLVAIVVFCAHLVMRDVKRLRQVETMSQGFR